MNLTPEERGYLHDPACYRIEAAQAPLKQRGQAFWLGPHQALLGTDPDGPLAGGVSGEQALRERGAHGLPGQQGMTFGIPPGQLDQAGRGIGLGHHGAHQITDRGLGQGLEGHLAHEGTIQHLPQEAIRFPRGASWRAPRGGPGGH